MKLSEEEDVGGRMYCLVFRRYCCWVSNGNDGVKLLGHEDHFVGLTDAGGVDGNLP
jgi:hypothetical protein